MTAAETFLLVIGCITLGVLAALVCWLSLDFLGRKMFKHLPRGSSKWWHDKAGQRISLHGFGFNICNCFVGVLWHDAELLQNKKGDAQ